MMKYLCILFTFSLVGCQISGVKEPTVFISILVRNKAHTLPYFLTLLENLDYPKDRITLYIRSHHNSDESLEILNLWLNKVSSLNEYHNILKDLDKCDSPCLMDGEHSPIGWTEQKFIHIMNERQKAFNLSRFYWSDFFWNLDSDVFLLEASVLKDLIKQKLPVTAPLLTSLGHYSNFWGDMNEDFYYARSADYSLIRERKKIGCHEVAMVHSSQLIDLRYKHSDLISFHHDNIQDYPGPLDDLIVFALSCELNGIPMYVCNQQNYGMMMLPLEDDQTLADDLEILRYTLLETTSRHLPISVDPIFNNYLISKLKRSKLGLDEIYLINLERRPDRMKRMEYNLDLLGIQAKFESAVDGRDITPEFIKTNGIQMLTGFLEPYHERPLKLGEIGCFMSHYRIWEEVVRRNLDMVLVLEDDIRFDPFFVSKFNRFVKELKDRREDWDLAFVGRKILHNAQEQYLEGSDNLVEVDYTHWTLGYIITRDGAEKLLKPKPLGKMIPVDEYIPVMYDKHPNKTWSSYFPERNLKAVSVSPRLIYPTHYTGEEGYISDTEDTTVIHQDIHEEASSDEVLKQGHCQVNNHLNTNTLLCDGN